MLLRVSIAAFLEHGDRRFVSPVGKFEIPVFYISEGLDRFFNTVAQLVEGARLDLALDNVVHVLGGMSQWEPVGAGSCGTKPGSCGGGAR